jgi:hypothetical protein
VFNLKGIETIQLFILLKENNCRWIDKNIFTIALENKGIFILMRFVFASAAFLFLLQEIRGRNYSQLRAPPDYTVDSAALKPRLKINQVIHKCDWQGTG